MQSSSGQTNARQVISNSFTTSSSEGVSEFATTGVGIGVGTSKSNSNKNNNNNISSSSSSSSSVDRADPSLPLPRVMGDSRWIGLTAPCTLDAAMRGRLGLATQQQQQQQEGEVLLAVCESGSVWASVF